VTACICRQDACTRWTSVPLLSLYTSITKAAVRCVLAGLPESPTWTVVSIGWPILTLLVLCRAHSVACSIRTHTSTIPSLACMAGVSHIKGSSQMCAGRSPRESYMDRGFHRLAHLNIACLVCVCTLFLCHARSEARSVCVMHMHSKTYASSAHAHTMHTLRATACSCCALCP